MTEELTRLLEISKEACRYLSAQKGMVAKDIAYDLSKSISQFERCLETETTRANLKTTQV